jgi:predicted regulator of Ras-like GTPase activity (Roadblock/LC7/MglB family)
LVAQFNSILEGISLKGGTAVAMSKTEELTALLKDLEATTPDIEASAIVSVDGLMIASALPRDVEEDRVAAMSAAMLSLGERTAAELARGSLSEVYVKGENGYVVLMASGENAVLTALARKDAKLGLVFLDMKRTAEEVGKII